MMLKVTIVVMAMVGIAVGPALVTGTGTAEATIHEITAAYCSGGGVGVIEESGELEAPGVDSPESPAFARPVIASGAIDPETLTVTDKPNAKFAAGTTLEEWGAGSVTRPSAEHCAKSAFD
jgi:hypothetical protein